MKTQIRTILISPHADDIAYSLGGSLISNFFKKPTIMITVFTESIFSPRMKLNNSKKVSEIRHLEDLNFAKKVGLELEKLNFPEPPLRGKCSNSDIFQNNHPELDPIFEQVYNSLSNVIRSYPDALVISPMGLGNHIDHLMVIESCLRIYNEKKINLAFYEDIPYASILTLEQIKANKDFLNIRLKTSLRECKINITSSFDKKKELLQIYRTQIGNKLPIGVRLHAARLGMKNEELMDYLWNNQIFRYLFYYHSNFNPGLFERIWYL